MNIYLNENKVDTRKGFVVLSREKKIPVFVDRANHWNHASPVNCGECDQQLIFFPATGAYKAFIVVNEEKLVKLFCLDHESRLGFRKILDTEEIGETLSAGQLSLVRRSAEAGKLLKLLTPREAQIAIKLI